MTRPISTCGAAMAVVAAISLSACASADWKEDLAKRITQTGAEVLQSADEAADEAVPMSQAQQKHSCGMSPEDAGKAGRIKTTMIKTALSAASRQLKVEDIELPERIQSPCYAKVRWDYVDRKSVFWAGRVAEATNMALEALEIDYQIEDQRLFAKGDEPVSRSEFNDMRKGVDTGLEKLLKGIEEKEVANEALLAQATGAMQAALTYGAELVGWDQRLVEFMRDNTKWTMNQGERLATFKEQARLVGGTFKSVKHVSDALKANRTEGLDPVAIQAGRQSSELEGARYDAQLVAELDL